ncbi:MAG: PAS domain S-box protein [Alphaproteobacteria bacterium]|nr:PAS domain S-box protein [Alphaproteobacteria bacterium]
MKQPLETLPSRRRIASYWLTGIILSFTFSALHGHEWRGSVQLHTLMEVTATLLAAFVGAMALVRHYSKKDTTFLFIGAGFLGTAFLDAYHGIVTLEYFRPFIPSDLPSLISWSWIASRQFLSVMLFLSWFLWMRSQKLGPESAISERTVYIFTASFTLLSFIFFAFVPLPTAYYPNLVFHRPEELLPALVFLMALVGYLKKGRWRYDTFEHWLVLSLIVGFIGQALFISHSGQLFDYEFDVAHLLKKASYVCVLIGLMVNMYTTFHQAEGSEAVFRGAIESLQESFALYDKNDCLVIYNDEFVRLHWEVQDTIRPGMPFEELIRNTVKLGLIPEAVGREEDFIRERIKQHLTPQEMILREKSDGIWYLINEAHTPDGGIAVTQTDISELKFAEQALRESEARTRAIVDNAIDGIITIDERGTVQSINPAAETIFGYSESELLGQNVSMLAAEPYRSAHDRYLANYLTTNEPKIIGSGREVEGERANGERFPMDLAVSEVVLDDQRVFVGIVRDITERKEMDRIKGEFISTVSHELRTPLTSIRGSLGLASGGAVGKIPEKAKAMIDMASQNTERLINLVNDILDIEKLESGSLEFQFDSLDIASLIDREIVANQGFANQHGVEFIVAKSEPDLLVWGDRDRLAQVLANLLSNAAKFSPTGEKIEITAVHHNGNVRVSVADRGPGIPEEFRESIFSKFTQVDSSDNRKVGGTGLGLNISRNIIEKHGGDIGYEPNQDQGTVFYFDLPILEEAPKPTAGLQPSVREGARILICEDDKDIAGLLSIVLEQNGYLSDIAYNAEQAEALLREHSYDAMTLDLILPGKGGISLLRSLREDDRTRDLPVIVISVAADERRGELQAGEAVGIIDWLEKPIDQERLLSAVFRSFSESKNRPRILYVEDDTDLVRVVTHLLEDIADVVTVPTVKDGKDRLSNDTFDMVLIDIGLPDGSGADLLAFLKTDGETSVPAIIFSGQDVGSDIAAEVNAVLVKSRTSNEQLVQTIKQCIHSKQPPPE